MNDHFRPVGNPAPDFYGEIRPGANLYTDSIVALDAKTGKLLWYRQFIPHDVHDADLSQVSPLFTTTIDGLEKNKHDCFPSGHTMVVTAVFLESWRRSKRRN